MPCRLAAIRSYAWCNGMAPSGLLGRKMAAIQSHSGCWTVCWLYGRKGHMRHANPMQQKCPDHVGFQQLAARDFLLRRDFLVRVVEPHSKPKRLSTRMPNGVLNRVERVSEAVSYTSCTSWGSQPASDCGQPWHQDFLLLSRKPRGSRLSSFLGRSGTSFDALTIDTAVLPADKMLDIRKACKLNIDDPLDTAGPAKIFRDNLETGSNCAEKVAGNLFRDSLGESAGTKYKGEMPVELGGQEREDFEAIEDTCHDFASLLLHRLSRKENNSVSRVDAVRLLKSFGRCLEAMGQGTTLLGCQMGGSAGEDQPLCEKEEGVAPGQSSWF